MSEHRDMGARYKIEADEKWSDVNIPAIEFPAGWKVQLTPPFGGAMARFRATNTHGSTVSVYFDQYDALGHYGEPYWEVYQIDGERLISDPEDVTRFPAADTEGMVKFIETIGNPAYAAMFAAGITD
jgi:hypothetical protein